MVFIDRAGNATVSLSEHLVNHIIQIVIILNEIVNLRFKVLNMLQLNLLVWLLLSNRVA